MLMVDNMQAQSVEDLFREIGIEGGIAAVANAAASFIRRHPLYSTPPSSKDLSETEIKLLQEGKFPEITAFTTLSENMTIVAGEVGVMIASALSQTKAANLLSVDESRIRQRIGKGTLYAIAGDNNKKVLPRFQFTKTGTLPGLEKVLPAINNDVHPIAIQRFFLTPSEDLYAKEMKTMLSPRDWLIARYSPEPIVLMAADL